MRGQDRMANMLGLVSAIAMAAVLAACATGRASGARPDDMSLARHRATATELRKVAAQHRKTYDPESRATRRVVDEGYTLEEYNPTEDHLVDAKRKLAHAKQHEAAARALEKFETGSCRRFPARSRVACPLLGQVTRAVPIAGGSRLHLAKGVKPKAMLAHMRCHYAYGRTAGRAGMDRCPLYLKGLRLVLAEKGRAVEITAEDAQVGKEIHKRAAAHVQP